MTSIRQLMRSIERASRPVYQQLEFPLAGIRLGREECRIVLELRRLREQLARS